MRVAVDIRSNTMPTLGELFEKHNIVANFGPQSSPRAKLLAQADKMLDMLNKYEDESDLNSKSTQYWWAPQTNEGQRRVSMRYGARNVEGTSAYVENSLASVTAHIKVLRQVVEESDDATWEPEEQRRAKK